MPNYVDNKKFLEALKQYKEDRKQHGDDARLSEYIGKCFWQIASNLASFWKFNNYTFKEDMISDAIFDCVRYANTFDPSKTNNPFSYFTMACYHAFVRRIKTEQKYLYTKYKSIENSEIFGLLSDSQGHDVEDQAVLDDIGYSDSSKQKMYDFITTYESKKVKPK